MRRVTSNGEIPGREEMFIDLYIEKTGKDLIKIRSGQKGLEKFFRVFQPLSLVPRTMGVDGTG